jgi:hypothetical protein
MMNIKPTPVIRATLRLAPLQDMQVSENGRFLVTESGTPVFLMVDTAWLMLERMKREEIAE